MSLLTFNQIMNDRTLSFNFIQFAMSEFKGFALVYDLYAVPCEMNFIEIKDIIFKNVDGIVFIADSQPCRLNENIVSFQKILRLVETLGKPVHYIPIVVQCNKQDLSLALPPEIIKKKLEINHNSFFSAIANKEIGVFETLKEVILRIGRRMDPMQLTSGFEYQQN